MATMDTVVRIGSLYANVDIVNRQYTFLTHTAAAAAETKLIVPAGAGVFCLGVCLTEGTVLAGKPVELGVGGVVKVRGGAVQNSSIHVTTDASGRAIVAGTGQHRLGFALDNCAVIDDLIRVLLCSAYVAP